MSYILTLLVLVPLVGSVAVWVAGITQRTAKWIALGFSLVETGLTTLLLVGFIEPSWGFAFGAPTFTRPPTAGLFVSLYYMERYNLLFNFGITYIVGVDGLSL